ncbi:CUB and sushi domain-containing protein 1-like [Branchiostoma floridae]|uniref:CUB and sushi domain-containing protein 1-like n=1 Tax=Branchiostoma floridae TaxID=7739 RepID=A0A9J7HMT6_BRAFL|nr:CUB and sushi domain-containing protein 1-like [Branchiostoma floridae]
MDVRTWFAQPDGAKLNFCVAIVMKNVWGTDQWYDESCTERATRSFICKRAAERVNRSGDTNECASGNGGCAQTCTNYIGSFQCSCGVGYNLNWDGKSCDDVNECASANGGCAQTCTNNFGSFYCSCGTGYNLNFNGLSCDDVNECNSANGGCAQTCTNNIGTFQCSCGVGYSLNGNGLSCDDVNECNSANGGCAQTCTNNIGSFQCSCGTGYNLNANGLLCDDVDECASANGGCDQTCTNDIGSFQCSCAFGYNLNGDGLACDRVECPLLTAPTNGVMTGSNFYQDVASFTCDSGYYLDGNSAINCQADATWSGAVPTCPPVPCPVLTAPVNGAMTGSHFYQDVAAFTCDSGYYLDGNSAITCQADATWTKECPLLTAPSNGAMTGTNFYQDVVEFTSKECPLLTAPSNGAMTGTNFYQDVVEFTCNAGYDLVGISALTCQADATWNGTAPTCTPVECPVLTAPVNGSISGSNFYQDWVQFWCIPGYEIEGSSTLACQVDATWSGSVPMCKRVQCPLLEAPANGVKTGSNFYQDVVTFTCYTGYDLVGTSSLTCLADATWNGNVSTCTRVQCPLLTAPVNGVMSGNNFFQDIVRFTCDAGYDRVGTSSLTCQADHTWNGMVPTCTRVQCPLLTAPENGGMTGQHFYQDVIQFTCHTGYELIGSSNLTCGADRTWDGIAPSCTRIECPVLIAPVNGGMTGFNFFQDVVVFSCDSGYDLVGTVSLTCQADRTWDGVAPTCTRVQCPMLSSPLNGDLTGPNFYMDTVLFTCNLGYELIGHSSSTCQADQSWNKNVPSCNGRVFTNIAVR